MPIDSKKRICSRAKGVRGELAFCKALFELYGINSRRSQQFCGSTGDAADIISELVAWCEIKHVERLNLAEAFDQARKDSTKSGRTPVVAHKKNRGPWMITMALSDVGKFISDNQHLFKRDKHENTSRSNDVSGIAHSGISDDEFSSNPLLRE